jgi:hypothetical protein
LAPLFNVQLFFWPLTGPNRQKYRTFADEIFTKGRYNTLLCI